MKEQILKLRAEGKTFSQIQKELGCSKSTISYHVSNGQKEKNQTRGQNYQRNLRKEIDLIRESNPCLDCGNFYPAVCMDFDHIEDNKAGNVAWMKTNRSKAAVFAEIAKCELVCSNCHRIRTAERSRA